MKTMWEHRSISMLEALAEADHSLGKLSAVKERMTSDERTAIFGIGYAIREVRRHLLEVCIAPVEVEAVTVETKEAA